MSWVKPMGITRYISIYLNFRMGILTLPPLELPADDAQLPPLAQLFSRDQVCCSFGCLSVNGGTDAR